MRNIRLLTSVVVLFLLLLATTSECLALKRIVPEKTKAEIVEKYLKNHQLELIEGIWSYTQMDQV